MTIGRLMALVAWCAMVLWALLGIDRAAQDGGWWRSTEGSAKAAVIVFAWYVPVMLLGEK